MNRLPFLLVGLQLLVGCGSSSNPPTPGERPIASEPWRKAIASGAGSGVRWVHVTHEGHVLALGTFRGSLDLGGGPLVAVGQHEMFLARFDDRGEHRWSLHWGGDATAFGYHTEDIDVDAEGNVVLTGELDGVANFGGIPLEGDRFIARIDGRTGEVLEAVSTEAIGFADEPVHPRNIRAVSDGYLVTGRYSAWYEGQPGEVGVLLKLDRELKEVWRRGCYSGNGELERIAADGDGNVYAFVNHGTSHYRLDFDMAPAPTGSHVYKFDRHGVEQWRAWAGDQYNLQSTSMQVTGDGRILVTFSGVMYDTVLTDAHVLVFGEDGAALPGLTLTGNVALYDVAAAPDGTLVAVGSDRRDAPTTQQNADLLQIRVDAGTISDERRDGGPLCDRLATVAVDRDNNIVRGGSVDIGGICNGDATILLEKLPATSNEANSG